MKEKEKSDSIKRHTDNWLKRCKARLWGRRLDRVASTGLSMSSPKLGWGSAEHQGWQACTLSQQTSRQMSRKSVPLPRGPPCSEQPAVTHPSAAVCWWVNLFSTRENRCLLLLPGPFLTFQEPFHKHREGLLISFRWWLSALHREGPPSLAFLLKWALLPLSPLTASMGPLFSTCQKSS